MSACLEFAKQHDSMRNKILWSDDKKKIEPDNPTPSGFRSKMQSSNFVPSTLLKIVIIFSFESPVISHSYSIYTHVLLLLIH